MPVYGTMATLFDDSSQLDPLCWGQNRDLGFGEGEDDGTKLGLRIPGACNHRMLCLEICG